MLEKKKKSQEKKLTDGWHIQDLYIDAMNSSSLLWSLFPETFACVMSYVIVDRGLHQNLLAIRGILRLLYKSLRHQHILIPKCDVVLYTSSDKPSNRPAMKELAEKLSSHGFKCGILTPSNFTCGEKDYPSVVSTLYSCDTFFTAANSILRSFFVTLILLLTAIPKKILFKHLFYRFFSVWNELAHSRIREKSVRKFLKETSTKLLITHNEKIPIASELVIAAKEMQIKSSLFLCEHPDVLTQPVLSGELWVYDHSFEASMSEKKYWFSKHSCANIKVIGHPESDLVLKKQNNPLVKHKIFDSRLKGRKIFLFASEYVSNGVWNRGPVTNVCIKWLYDAAMRCPEWVFIYKTRPLHHHNFFPEIPEKGWPENMIFYRDEAELSDFLASGRVDAAGALGSLALYCSARLGIPSFRFNASKKQMKMPFLDIVTNPILSAEQLIEALESIEPLRSKFSIDSDRWQYRGSSLKRMENLSLELLSKKN